MIVPDSAHVRVAIMSMHRVLILGAAMAACSGGEAKQGAIGQECYPNGTCNDALVCSDNACVGLPDAAILPDAATPLPDPETVVNQVLGAPVRDLDLLFLVDDSHSMAEEQQELALQFPLISSALAKMEGGLPNLHVGVISTDLGIGSDVLTSCQDDGLNAILQNVAQQPGCEPPTDRYISDVDNGAGGREQNYSGSLEETFSCISKLGVEGCGFEQHFAAIRRALDGSTADNEGFLREDAMLAIVAVSDEDDCSATDQAIYDLSPELDTLESSLGPLSSYRCFEFGVTCKETTDDPVFDRTNFGDRSECVPRQSSPYLEDVSGFVSFLQGLKATPGRVMFNVIVGTGPAAVSENFENGEPLVGTCASALGRSAPGIRLEAASVLLGMGTTQTICVNDLSAAFSGLAAEMVARMSGTCLIEDAAPSSCSFNDVSGYDTEAAYVVQALPFCSEVATGACITLIENSADCVNGKTEAVIDRRDTTAAPNTVVVASCPR